VASPVNHEPQPVPVNAAAAGQAAPETPPVHISGNYGYWGAKFDVVRMQPRPLSYNAVVNPKSVRQAPACNGIPSQAVTTPEVWFDTTVKYVANMGQEPVDLIRHYFTGEPHGDMVLPC
jgi:hypothetical protein